MTTTNVSSWSLVKLLKFGRALEAEFLSWFWIWSIAQILSKVWLRFWIWIVGNILRLRFVVDFEVWSRFWDWNVAKIDLKEIVIYHQHHNRSSYLVIKLNPLVRCALGDVVFFQFCKNISLKRVASTLLYICSYCGTNALFNFYYCTWLSCTNFVIKQIVVATLEKRWSWPSSSRWWTSSWAWTGPTGW